MKIRRRDQQSWGFISPFPLNAQSRAVSLVCTRRNRIAFPSRPCMVLNRTEEEVSPLNESNVNYGSNEVKGEDFPINTQPMAADSGVDSEDRDESPVIEKRLIIAGISLVAILALGSLGAATGVVDSQRLVSLSEWFEGLGPFGAVLYGGLYFLLELVGVPALPLTMGSGYLFGVYKGTALVSLSSTAAAAAGFLIARYWLRDSVTKVAQRYPRFRAMDRAIGRQGFKFVFLLRLSPLLPFSISNYLYGLTSVKFMEYVLGSWLGMLPGTVAYVSAGAAVNALTELSSGKQTNVNPVLVVLGLAATVGALSLIGKIATDAIEEDGDEEIAGQN